MTDTIDVTAPIPAAVWWRLAGDAELFGVTVADRVRAVLINYVDHLPVDPRDELVAGTVDARLHELWDKGADDRTIGQRLRLTTKQVSAARRRLGLDANKGQKRA